MLFPVFLLLVWLSLTMLATWAVIRLTRDSRSTDAVNDPANDLQAARRVLHRLRNHGVIGDQEEQRLRVHLASLSEIDSRRAAAGPTPVSRDDQVVMGEIFDDAQPPRYWPGDTIVSGLQPPSVDKAPAAPIAEPSEPAEPPPATSPQPCWLDEAEVPASQPGGLPLPGTEPSPAPLPAARREPSLTISEVITSFLAAHNIRWGELVAGMLIVICSIGLVISLWHTLIETHPAVPSLIFLAANTAIFAAGLYTLSRWRLRDTSRAMLIIATLLVPLSILAGLATAGTGANALSLNDPITLGSMMVIGVVYLVLLWQGGKALVGLRNAGPLVLSVAGPSAMLPLLPAAVRTLGSSAAFLVAGGSLALAAALSWVVLQSRQTGRDALGAAAGRNRLLIMAVGSFSLAMLIGNVAFNMPEYPQQLLRIAIAAIPGALALSATGGSLSLCRRRPTLALTGTVICVLGAAASFVVLGPAMVGMSWLWSWAAIFSGAAVLSAWAFRQPLWLPIATVASGVALLMWAPVYFQGVGWQELPLWRRFVGGEPMLAALAVGVAVLAASGLLRSPAYRNPLQLAGLGWIALAFSLATVLSVAPQQWAGTVPAWVVTGLLALVAAASMSAPIESVAKHAAWSTLPLWLSILRPLELGSPLAAPRVWMMTALAIAATLAVASEIARRWRPKDAIDYWQQLSASMAIGASLIAVVFVSRDWVDSATTLAASAALLWWVGISRQRIDALQVAQVCSLAAAFVTGWGRFHETLMARESWLAGIAPWGWAILLAALTLLWLIVREICRFAARADTQSQFLRPLAWYAGPERSPTRLLDWGMLHAAVIAIAIAGGEAFASLATGVWDSAIIVLRPAYLLPAMAVAGTGVALALAKRQLENSQQDQWLRVALAGGVSVLAWAAAQLSMRILQDPAQRLVFATTLIAGGCFALDYWIRSTRRVTDVVGRGIASIAGVFVLSLASAVLLATGWAEQIFDGQKPQVFHTCSVAAWWISGAAFAGWIGWRDRETRAVSLSAALTPAAVFLVMPLLVVDSPIAWIQWSAIASGVWALIAGWCFRRQMRTCAISRNISLALVAAIGFVCSGMMILYVLFANPAWAVYGSWGGVIVSIIGAVMFLKDHHQFVPQQPFLAPLAITLLSGQATGLAMQMGMAGRYQVTLLASLWLISAGASLVYFARHVLVQSAAPVRVHYWHSAVMSVAACILCAAHSAASRHLWLGLAGCFVAGLLVSAVAWSRLKLPSDVMEVFSARLLGWFLLAVGSYFVTELTDFHLHHWDGWTAIVAWLGFWIVGWRLCCPEVVRGDVKDPALPLARRALPDSEAALFVAGGMLVELFLMVVAAEYLDPATLADPLLWLRVIVAGAIAASCTFRGSRKSALESGLIAGVAAVAIVAVCAGADRGAEWMQRIMLASLAGSTLIAMLVYLGQTCLGIGRRASASWVTALSRNLAANGQPLRPLPIRTARFALAMWRISLVAAGIISVAVTILLVNLETDPSIPMTIAAIALIAVAVAELAEMTGQIKMRYATVILGFLATGMWASVNVGATVYPQLTTSMQWLVAWVLTAAVVGLAVPKLFGSAFADRWQPALRFGVILAGSLAAGSMLVMFFLETWIRYEADIEIVSRTRVYFVASTLAALSMIATLLGIFSGPGFRYRDTWRFSDAERSTLIVAAQVIGFLTWLHLHLCKSPLAHLGLRPYWPYIVMMLSFASVGITEWAKRREDKVLGETLRRTALYLPLIPVLGFWLSSTTFGLGAGDAGDNAWTYLQGRVSYQTLLAIGALYYGLLAFLWKGAMPRVASIVLGNTALWVILVQTPNWNFLAHPQAWLIPPAVCVLAVTHLYRDRLDAAGASSIRYAATLTIYVSSTADMLLQDIGATLSGPIILVLLALAGMTAGVVLRVRPFLYLGAIFVFIGVTSMVWHATRRIDEVWPWWAFGISTGILLLAGLMVIEKNKPKLQTLATALAKWES